MAELRELGYKLAVSWVSRPCAESDMSIVDCYLAAAGDTDRDDADVAALQQWRLRHGAMWVRLEVHGRRRVDHMLKSTVTIARAQESKLRAAAKRDINAVMERSPRGAIESMTVGTGDGASALTDPVDVAVECCEFSARRMSSMQPKWFRKYAGVDGHTVWVALGNQTRRGLIKKIDNDSHCTLQYDGDEHTTSGVRRGAMCLEWQLERSAASLNRRWKRRRVGHGKRRARLGGSDTVHRHTRRLRGCAACLGGHGALLRPLGVDGAAARLVHREARPWRPGRAARQLTRSQRLHGRAVEVSAQLAQAQ